LGFSRLEYKESSLPELVEGRKTSPQSTPLPHIGKPIPPEVLFTYYFLQFSKNESIMTVYKLPIFQEEVFALAGNFRPPLKFNAFTSH
jgi:hypothetical protein